MSCVSMLQLCFLTMFWVLTKHYSPFCNRHMRSKHCLYVYSLFQKETIWWNNYILMEVREVYLPINWEKCGFLLGLAIRWSIRALIHFPWVNVGELLNEHLFILTFYLQVQKTRRCCLISFFFQVAFITCYSS